MLEMQLTNCIDIIMTNVMKSMKQLLLTVTMPLAIASLYYGFYLFCAGRVFPSIPLFIIGFLYWLARVSKDPKRELHKR